MKSVTGHWSLVTACATALVGLALTVHSVRATPGALRQVKRKQADTEALRQLRAGVDRQQAAVRLCEEAGAARDLGAPAAARGGQVRPRNDRALIEGWSVKSVEVSFADVALADAAAFMAEAENGAPPWRVVECRIAASGPPGRGRVGMVMETIGEN
jgi:hypothetical protein